MPETRIITHDTYMKALALFTLANDHAVQSTQYADGLTSLLGYDERYAGHISDEIYSGGQRTSVAAFNKALEKEGIKVAAQKKLTTAMDLLLDRGVINSDLAKLLEIGPWAGKSNAKAASSKIATKTAPKKRKKRRGRKY